jgi:1A family penicillin-binding protein
MRRSRGALVCFSALRTHRACATQPSVSARRDGASPHSRGGQRFAPLTDVRTLRTRQHPLVYATWTALVILGIATGALVQRLWVLRAEIERLAAQLTLDAGPESTLIYDQHDELVSALFEQHRIGVPLDRMSAHAANAVVAVEDRRFFTHEGLDIRRIVKAGLVNLRARSIVQGGSTITQQLVRSLLLNRERSFTRKFKEAVLARRLEERYSKQDILEAYLNRVYFGDGYYGIEAASLGYFGKSATTLDVVEAATLAGLIKGPSLYSPTKFPERARQRRDLVLAQMRAQGMLSDVDYQAATAVPVHVSIARGDRTGVPDPRHTRGAEYFRDAVQRELLQRFGSEAVYTGGLRVYTTLDRDLQTMAEGVVAARISEMPAGDVGEPLQGALVALDPQTGFVKAIVGGGSFKDSSFNRALDAKRQPGSAFKPFIFAAALESGYWPSSQIERLDEPIATPEGPWLPDGEHETTTTRLRDALIVSSNRAAAHLLQDVGLYRTLDLVSRFGITSPMPAVPSVALGTGEVTLFELTAAYAVFANRGLWRAPTTIRRVIDRYGRELYRATGAERRVISESSAFLMTSMMADVIARGTGTRARGAGFKLQAAGKTGTSTDYTDAWFVGYTPHLVTGVWFGFDQPRTIMDRGFAGVVAVPAWARFMTAATKGAPNDWFTVPGSLEKVTLCRVSGLRATDRCTLPVVEEAPFEAETLEQSPQFFVREGGVYQEFRAVGSMHEPCHLTHGWPGDAVPASYETPAGLPPPIPGPIIPGSTIQTTIPTPPRAPGNRSPHQ